MKEEILVIYHIADLDGKLSGVICKNFLEEQDETVVLMPWDYHYKMTSEILEQIAQYKRIFVVDISIPEVLQGEIKKRTVWIDHHITAIEKFDERIPGLRIDGIAASRLCYQYFTNKNFAFLSREDFEERNVVEPEIVALAGEYDVFFEREDEYHRCVNFAIGGESIDRIWDYFQMYKDDLTDKDKDITETPLYSVILQGEPVLNFIYSLGEREKKFELTLETDKKYTFLCINSSIGTSLIFEKLPRIKDGFAVFKIIAPNLVKVTIYPHDTDKVHGGNIAKRYKGGGHAGAAGFTITADKFFTMIK